MPDRIPAAMAGARTPAGAPLNDDHYRIGDQVTGVGGHRLRGKTCTVVAWSADYDHSGLTAAYSVKDPDGNITHGVEHAHLRPADPVIRINTSPDRGLTVYVNGVEVGHTNYDAVGWSGLTVVTNIVTAVAAAAGLTVTRTDTYDDPDDGDEVDGES
jgi:hypothetical protein